MPPKVKKMNRKGRRTGNGDPPSVNLSPWKSYVISVITSDPVLTVHVTPNNTLLAWGVQSGVAIDPSLYEIRFLSIDVWGSIVANSSVLDSGTCSLEPYYLAAPATANTNRQAYPLRSDQGSGANRAHVRHVWSRVDSAAAFTGLDTIDAARLLSGRGGRVHIRCAIRGAFNIPARMTSDEYFVQRTNQSLGLPEASFSHPPILDAKVEAEADSPDLAQ